MPRTTERFELVRALRHRALLLLTRQMWLKFASKRHKRLAREISQVLTTVAMVSSPRYLHPRTSMAPKMHAFKAFAALELSAVAFKQQFRMTREAFRGVLRLIRVDPVFYNDSHHKQAPIGEQLAVTLNRLGTTGNGTSIGAVAVKFGLSHGTVMKYTERVVEAIGNLADLYIRFPDARERAEISRRVGHKFGFDGCVGFVDGTHIILSQRPGVSGESFFTRKQRYAMNAQVVCDDKKVIRALVLGWPGSVHDSRAWRSSDMATRPGIFFSHGQYLMADSAYALSKYCMKPYTEPLASLPDNALFNWRFARTRVVNEHTIGILKNRWSSLKGLPHQIQKSAELPNVVNWITACAVLHNVLMGFGDLWDPTDVNENDDNDRNAPGGVYYAADGVDFRAELQRKVLEWVPPPR